MNCSLAAEHLTELLHEIPRLFLHLITRRVHRREKSTNNNTLSMYREIYIGQHIAQGQLSIGFTPFLQ